MTGECSGALDCPCHACIETARAAVSLGSGRLGLFLPNGGDAPLVYRLSKSQGPVVTVGSLSSYDWSQAHVVVDQTCVDDYVLVRFPSTPRPLPSSGRFVGCFLFFDRPHGLAEECDAQLLEWSKAEELRQEQWWRQRAVAVLLGLHSRVGAISALRVLSADAVSPILRIMRRVSGPGLETEHLFAKKTLAGAQPKARAAQAAKAATEAAEAETAAEAAAAEVRAATAAAAATAVVAAEVRAAAAIPASTAEAEKLGPSLADEACSDLKNTR